LSSNAPSVGFNRKLTDRVENRLKIVIIFSKNRPTCSLSVNLIFDLHFGPNVASVHEILGSRSHKSKTQYFRSSDEVLCYAVRSDPVLLLIRPSMIIMWSGHDLHGQIVMIMVAIKIVMIRSDDDEVDAVLINLAPGCGRSSSADAVFGHMSHSVIFSQALGTQRCVTEQYLLIFIVRSFSLLPLEREQGNNRRGSDPYMIARHHVTYDSSWNPEDNRALNKTVLLLPCEESSQ
ncbi:hypothetical protein STEG23_022252, partial [Scotinomys teguina]